MADAPAEIEVAQQALAVALEHDDPSDRLEAEFDLALAHNAAAWAAVEGGNLVTAAEHFRLASERPLLDVAQEAIAAARDSPDEAEIDEEDATQLLTAARELPALCMAYGRFFSGQATRLGGRDPQAAAELFRDAHDAFEQLAKEGVELESSDFLLIMAALARVLEGASLALETLIRRDYGSAAAAFQRISIEVDRLATETIPGLIEAAEAVQDDSEDAALELQRLRSVRDATEIDRVIFAGAHQLARFYDQQARGNWAAAVETGRKVCELSKQAAERYETTDVRWLRDMSRFEYHHHRGAVKMIEGRFFQEERRWEDAIAAYTESGEAYSTAADFVLKTGLPQATAMQETIYNHSSASIDLALRATRTERALHEQIAKLQGDFDSLVASLRGAGITVNTHAEATAAANQTVEIALHFEVKVREAVTEVRDAARVVELDDDTRRQVLDEAEALLNSKEHAEGFLSRARRFADNVAGIVQSGAATATPLAAAVERLLQLVA